MTLTGFRLTLPDGQVFRATQNTEITVSRNSSYLFNGGRSALALFERFVGDGGADGVADGLDQSVYLGTGAASKTIRLRFTQSVGSGESWGTATAAGSAVTKRDALVRAVETQTISSEPGQTATLEWGEYSSGGKYAPKNVVIGDMDLPVDATDEASSFTGTIECLEAADAETVIHGSQQTED
jgi:hypothetical protein